MTDGFCARARIFRTGAHFLYVNIKQCYLVQKRCLKITYIGYAGKSKVSSMKTARLRLNLHAMVHKAPNVPTEHFNTGLKHQRLRTAFSWKHIWNLPAIYTLVIYRNI